MKSLLIIPPQGPKSFIKQMTASRFRKLRTSISLAVSLIFLGSVLAAYQASFWGWIGTMLSLSHLSKTGRGAIPLALAWATGILWIAAYQYSTPVGFLWRNARYWASSLIFLWMLVTVIIFAVSKIPTTFQYPGNKRHIVWLISSILMNLCLGIGGSLYKYGLGLQ